MTLLFIRLFLSIEARRYRFFDFWRMRAHVMELLILRADPARSGNSRRQWLERTISITTTSIPNLHISLLEAVGTASNYGWIFAIQVVAYVGKLLIHPTPIAHIGELWDRTTVGPSRVSWYSWPDCFSTAPG